ncbi:MULTISPECIES: autotransporter outer membrane beta-barrel domain-containing protein [unclassified Serratia (in: enterobacteria)]|uniref:autotransporter family protein n=1 Tax=unclassified Serratia (in: enterobacteria) TaxID=2647522 RepID=UPI0005018093|nr:MULTISPECIES: autotransporter outer membrane beta-barrel domain-containing protein [unclassified Serratia (in: enterobacteria)]KFK93110.1 hypothetical protein JV45_18490 [Serratia sp. Ag2]KFK99202.1 hypothetical protein IV04_07740 [Serratia sp. Ag1]
MTINKIFLITLGLSLTISPAIASADTTVPDYSYRADVGTYLGNQIAARSLFSHTLHQRKTSPGSDQLWLRASGYSTKNLNAADDNLPIDMNRQVFQLGGDIFALQQENQEWTLGLMTGYGRADTESHTANMTSDGRVNGYSVGLYSTWYQDSKNHNGAYIDSWLQYSWFNNRASQEDYNSNNFSLSLETGYAFQPLPTWELVIEPQLQLIYNDFSTDDYRDAADTFIRQGDAPDFTSRAGIRWYSDQDDNITAYLATNWWHNNGSNTVYFNQSRIAASSLSDLFEVKVGLKTPASSQFQLWFEGGSTMGKNSYQDYGASLGLSYRW